MRIKIFDRVGSRTLLVVALGSLRYDFKRLRWLGDSKNELTRRAVRVGTVAIDVGNNFGKMKFSIFLIENFDFHDFWRAQASRADGFSIQFEGVV